MPSRHLKSSLWLALVLPACTLDASGMQALDPVPEGDDAVSSDDEDDVVPRDAGSTGAKDSRVREASAPDSACSQALTLVVRDFTDAHPDFEKFGGVDRGIVADTLGANGKPVYAGGSSGTLSTSGPSAFAQWYSDVKTVNVRLLRSLEFTEERPGVFAYDSAAFFPIDGVGFGNGPKGIELPLLGNTIPDHNYLFTSEAHLEFRYAGGERFTFRGDDDLWVFIDRKLAIDLGGTHPAESAMIELDQLGLEPGKRYPLDIFHAERQTVESNYRIETTIDLSCIQNVP